jgi:hypothetical protein
MARWSCAPAASWKVNADIGERSDFGLDGDGELLGPFLEVVLDDLPLAPPDASVSEEMMDDAGSLVGFCSGLTLGGSVVVEANEDPNTAVLLAHSVVNHTTVVDK